MLSEAATVLVVEDSPDDLELTLRALARAGTQLQVVVARDGVEALDYLFAAGAAALPRVVLLDVKLPRLGGIEVLRRIKSHPRTRHLPVVMLTSSAEDTDLRTCYDLGANSYVVKPVDIELFYSAVGGIGEYWMSINRARGAPTVSPVGTR
jgi:two-component system response regulator